MALKSKISCICIILLICLVFTLFANNCFADTNVDGAIREDTTWTASGSPYIVIQSISVEEGATLTIEPGVRIEFYQETDQALDDKFNITVDGQLIAVGTEDAPIIFTSSSSDPQPGDWDYIKFTESAIGATYSDDGEYISGSIFEYVTVEYGGGDRHFSTINAHFNAPYLNYVTIKNNNYGGIGYNFVSEAFIDNSTFTNNSTDVDGGAIYSYESSLTIHDSTFANNSADDNGGRNGNGGAIYSYASFSGSPSSLTIDNNTFTNNSADGHGGAIYLFGTAAASTIDNSTFTNNSTDVDGGAIYSFFRSSFFLTINNSTFTNNSADDNGGAIGSPYSSLTINDSTFAKNSAYSHGSAIYSKEIILTDTLIYQNHGYTTLLTESGSVNRCTIANNYPLLDEDDDDNIVYGIYISSSLTISDSNIFGHEGYDIYNNSSSDITATNNYWNTTNESDIHLKIFDVFDDSSKGEVIFYPFLDSFVPNGSDINIQNLVTEIYVATFERAPAYSGLMYWCNAIYTGDFTIEQVAQSFFDQPETEKNFPEGSSNSEFITTIYYNVLNRAPAASGLAYWVDALDGGAMRRDQAIMAIINGAKSSTGSSEDAAMLAKKIEIGIYFANSEIGDSITNANFMTWASNIISFATSDDFNIEEAEEYIQSLLLR